MLPVVCVEQGRWHGGEAHRRRSRRAPLSLLPHLERADGAARGVAPGQPLRRRRRPLRHRLAARPAATPPTRRRLTPGSGRCPASAACSSASPVGRPGWSCSVRAARSPRTGPGCWTPRPSTRSADPPSAPRPPWLAASPSGSRRRRSPAPGAPASARGGRAAAASGWTASAGTTAPRTCPPSTSPTPCRRPDDPAHAPQPPRRRCADRLRRRRRARRPVRVRPGRTVLRPLPLRRPRRAHRDVRRRSLGWEPGEFTDDTQMALLVASSLVERDGLDEADLFDRFRTWARGRSAGRRQPDPRRPRLRSPLGRRRGGALRPVGRAAGNGSLMRTTPAAIWFARFGPAATMDAARRISALTHGDPSVGEGCAVFHELVRVALDGGDPLAAVPSALELVAPEHRDRWATVLAEDWTPDAGDREQRRGVADARPGGVGAAATAATSPR